ncbi:MAG: hypothetical protein V1783_06310, partial [Bacteroidota bacterium]
FVLYLTAKTEGWLKIVGFVTGWLLIVLAVLSMLLSSIFAAKKPYFRHCPFYLHEKMKLGMPIIQKQQEELKNQKTENNRDCPVKTIQQIKKELKEGKRTGAACQKY